MKQSRILLYNIESINLIIECPSGVVYQNQVGGQLCVQAEAEGVIAPIHISSHDLSELLSFPFPQGYQGLSDSTVEFLTGFLASSPACSFLELDQNRINESFEAWVHVVIRSVPPRFDPNTQESYTGNIFGFSGMHGLITWPNSD